ncbi:CDP-diacylglycerol--serine O-phosphatidyltransferase [Pontixanthobacter sp.]|uniref:CDP-diacylglycerol--serine O-phosphatidyltransferase n=1 Tax=Pontixanthobacter sp. TaxID=2792078 RepID=UPI003C7BF51F
MSDNNNPRLGPKSAEDEPPSKGRKSKGLALRGVIPNAITAAALCSGLTGIKFAIAQQWSFAVLAIVVAGVLDGIDGRIARLLNAQSRFGAELDSLADSLSFGMAPAIIFYLWTLQELPRVGWLAALAFAICCALRLARFNAQIDMDEQPHKSAGFLTGIPAPVAAGLMFLPFYLWTATGIEEFRLPILNAVWMVVIAFWMISNTATLSWSSLRPRRNIRLEFIALFGLIFGGAIWIDPWWTLAIISIGYLALMPYGWLRYAKVKRLRKTAG